MIRQCNHCKEFKNILYFYPDKCNSTGYGYKCKPCDYLARTARRLLKPWLKHLASLRKRCNNIKHHSYYRYGGRGIKALITKEEIKELWFRDKAFEMKKPSIDRKDNNGHYEFSNCQFIEMSENSKKSSRKPILQFDLNGKFIKEWQSPICVQKELSFCASLISKCARKQINHAYKFKWRYSKKDLTK